jgi:hypothetical protein
VCGTSGTKLLAGCSNKSHFRVAFIMKNTALALVDDAYIAIIFIVNDAAATGLCQGKLRAVPD